MRCDATVFVGEFVVVRGGSGGVVVVKSCGGGGLRQGRGRGLRERVDNSVMVLCPCVFGLSALI